MDKQMSLPAWSDELAQIERMVPWVEWESMIAEPSAAKNQEHRYHTFEWEGICPPAYFLSIW